MTQTEIVDNVDETSTPEPDSTVATLPSAEQDDTTPTATPRRVPVVALVVGAVVLLALGFVAGRASAPDEASTSSATEAVAPEESDAAQLLAVGMALHTSGDLNAAEEAYQRVLVLSPQDPYALYNLGLIRQTQGNLTAAIDFYTRSLASDSTLVSAQYNRALARRDSGDGAGAIADLEAVIVVQPENAGALYNLGNLKIAEGDIDGGTKLVNQAIEIDPSLRGDQ